MVVLVLTLVTLGLPWSRQVMPQLLMDSPMDCFVEIPVLLDRHPDIDIKRALEAIDTTSARQPVTFTRSVPIGQRTGLVVAGAHGVDLGWISPTSLARLSAYLDGYAATAAHYSEPLLFGCMIRLKLVRRTEQSGKSAALDLALREFCAWSS